MSRVMRQCLNAGCTELTRASRCPTHQRAHEGARGRRQARGYDAEYEANRATLRATAPPTCWLCHEPIDLTLPGTHPDGWTADHYVPTSRHGSNALTNLRPAHQRCNNARNNR